MSATLDDLGAALSRHGVTVRQAGRDIGFFYVDETARISETRWMPLPASGLTSEHLTDLTTLFRNAGELDNMNIFSTDLFKYLQGDMIGDSTITMTVLSVSMESISAGGRGGAQAKPVLHFKEKDKTLILNKTNALALAERLGPETDKWAGARVKLAAPMVDAFGKQKRAVRVVGVEPAASGNGNGKPGKAEAIEAEAAQQPALVDANGSGGAYQE